MCYTLKDQRSGYVKRALLSFSYNKFNFSLKYLEALIYKYVS